MNEQDLEALLAEPRMQEFKESLIANLPSSITPEEAGRIINQGSTKNNSERLKNIVKAIVTSAQSYIKKYKGISNGEIETIAGDAYHVPQWKIDQVILNNPTKNIKTFKKHMKEKAEKNKVRDQAGKGVPLHHKNIIRKNHILWEDPKHPGVYVNDYLINHDNTREQQKSVCAKTELVKSPQEDYKKNEVSLEETVKKKRIDETYTNTNTESEKQEDTYQKKEEPHVSPIPAILAAQQKHKEQATEELETTITNAEEFLELYQFGDNNFADNDTIPLEKEHIQKYLKDMNIKDKNVRKQLRRSIIRDYELQKMLYGQGKNELNQQKLYHFANLFNKSKQFRKDLNNVFNIVKN